MKPLKSICILRLSSIGDVTHIVPIINTIKKNSVETSITWVIGSTEYQLVKTMPNINFIVIDKNNFFDSVKKLRNLRGQAKFGSFLSNVQGVVAETRRTPLRKPQRKDRNPRKKKT